MSEIGDRFPDDYRRWVTRSEPVADPTIERVEQMAARVCEALREIAQRVGAGTAVVVTHGGAARVGCASLLGWPHAVWDTLGVLGNCRFSELVFTEGRGWQLRAHNVG